MRVRLQWFDPSRQPLDVELSSPPMTGDELHFGESPNDFVVVVLGRRWQFDFYGSQDPAFLVLEVAER